MVDVLAAVDFWGASVGVGRVGPADGDLRLFIAKLFSDFPSKVTCLAAAGATGDGSAGRGGGAANCLTSPLAVGVATADVTAGESFGCVVTVVWTGCPSGPGASEVAGVVADGVDGRLPAVSTLDGSAERTADVTGGVGGGTCGGLVSSCAAAGGASLTGDEVGGVSSGRAGGCGAVGCGTGGASCTGGCCG